MAKDEKGDGQSGGIQSLDAALRLLNAMAERHGPASLSDLARECGMPPSKVHRYLASFQHAGLVIQAGRSGKYDLGPGAVILGLSALARHDFVNRAADALPDLCAESGLTALLAVWGNLGPTVVRWERAASPTVTSMGLGSTLPLLNSASGRTFLAWAPPAPLKAIRDAELRRIRQNPKSAVDFEPSNRGIDEMVQKIRSQGYAWVDGRFIPGLVAIAAPILDWQGEAQASITLVGTDPHVTEADSDAVRLLIKFCKDHSFETRDLRTA